MAHAAVCTQRTAKLARELSGEPPYDLGNHGLCPGFDLSRRLVLNRMVNVDCVKVRPPKGCGLCSSRKHELVRGYWNRRDTPIFEPDRVVQTARCAGPSIRESLDHRIHVPKLLDQCFRRRFGERWLGFADHASYGITLDQ